MNFKVIFCFYIIIISSLFSCKDSEENEFDFLLKGHAEGTITGTRSDNTTPINGRFNYPYSNFLDEAWFDEYEQLIIGNKLIENN